MVLELKSRFDMLQLRSDFEVMKLGVLPSRSLQLVPGKVSRVVAARRARRLGRAEAGRGTAVETAVKGGTADLK